MSKKKSIQAHQAKLRRVYLTKLNVPVRVNKITSKGVEVTLTLLKKLLTLKRSTPLFPYDKSKVKRVTILKRLSKKKKTDLTALPQKEITSPTILPEVIQPLVLQQPKRGPKGPRSQSVASVVDPMLFSGTYTRQQISLALSLSEIGKTLSNKDFGWYTGYRIAVLKEKGYLFAQLDNGIVKIFKPFITPQAPEIIELKPI